MHLDLKPANVLMDKNYNAKISDFGLSRVTKSINYSGLVGTPLYMAPEIFISQEISPAVDVYSYGLVLFSLFTKMRPFPALDPSITFNEFRDAITQSSQSPLGGEDQNELIDPEVRNLIELCTEQLPSNRKTFAQLVENDSEVIKGVYLGMSSGKHSQFANDFWAKYFSEANSVAFDDFFDPFKQFIEDQKQKAKKKKKEKQPEVSLTKV